jgi:hypothetical protein
LLLREAVDPHLVARVIDQAYAPDLTDDKVEKIGRDPFLIAYALVAPQEQCAVSTEVSAPKKTRANRRIPDVWQTVGVRCTNTFAFLRALNFRTSWKP